MQYVNGEATGFTTVKLPKTGTISTLQAVTINDNKIEDAAIELTYGKKLTEDLKFNNQVIAKKGEYLLAKSGSTLSVIVNPIDADASLYTFDLVDSKGKAPFVLGTATANKTEEALTRTATPNKGVYDIAVDFADANNIKVDGTYALITSTVNGTVASAYDVNVTAKAAPSITVGSFGSLDVEAGQELDLKKFFENAKISDYVVDYYFTLGDQTTANKYGISINGDKIKATNIPLGQTVNYDVKICYVLVDGTVVEETPKTGRVNFKYAIPEADLSNITWTINSTQTKKYISLASIKSQLPVATDDDIANYTVTISDFTWADGTELNEKTVTKNGTKYGKDGDVTFPTDASSNWYGNVTATIQQPDGKGGYTNANNVNNDLYIEYTFAPATVFPGEYSAVLTFTNGKAVLKTPVNITITEPSTLIEKNENYFVGNNAVAYGTPSVDVVTYDLNDLFKTTGMSYVETEYKNVDGDVYAPWLQTGTEISVPVYDNTKDADHFESVYATREYTAKYRAFGNAHIEDAVYKFNLTVKSPIYEGTFTSSYTADITNSDELEIPVSAFNGTDVYGDKYYIGNIYNYDSKGNVTSSFMASKNITDVTITAADDNAKNYVQILNNGGLNGATKETQYFAIQRKSIPSGLQVDTPCKFTVSFTDSWGRIKSTTITVVLKKTVN